MVDYWAYRIGTDAPLLAWFEQSPSGSKSLWFIGVLGTPNGGNPTQQATVPDAIAEQAAKRYVPPATPQLAVARHPLGPGQYHARIWRNNAFGLPTDQKAILSSDTSGAIQLRALDDIFTTVEPDPKSHGAYGHRLRHFLILACTDVEAGWAGVLSANGYPGDRWTTNDYIKLLKPMRLNEYKVRLASYPDYPEITPFEGWDPAKVGTTGFSPTESLKWYNAYNKVKHNREVNLSLATLEHVISAAAAMYVMEMAQFGRNVRGNGFFHSVALPNWKPEEHYFVPWPQGGVWKRVNYSF